MPITAVSARAVAADSLRNMIANCDTFIAATGLIDYIGAKDRIYLVEKFPDEPSLLPTTYKRPLAMVLLAVFEYRISKPGYPTGPYEFQLEIDAQKTTYDFDLMAERETTLAEQAIHALNFFGGTESELSQLGSTVSAVVNDANLRFDRITQIRPIERSRDTSERDFWRCRYAAQIF